MSSKSIIFSCCHIFREGNLLLDFLLKKAYKRTLCQQNILHVSSSLGFTLIGSNRPDNKLHIPENTTLQFDI